jgi:hypothetical protein
MEQRIFIKITQEEDLTAIETDRELVDRCGKETLSYPMVTYWQRCHRGITDVEDSPKSGRPLDFGIRLRIEDVFGRQLIRSLHTI